MRQLSFGFTPVSEMKSAVFLIHFQSLLISLSARHVLVSAHQESKKTEEGEGVVIDHSAIVIDFILTHRAELDRGVILPVTHSTISDLPF